MSLKNLSATAKQRAQFRYRLTIIVLFLICASMLNGCGSRFPELQKLAPLPPQPSCRVAVLPFINESNYAQADLIVYKIFMAELHSAAHYRVAQEGDIRKIYRQLRIYPQQRPKFDQLKIIADRLNAQFFIIGAIQEAQEKTSRRSANPSLTFTLQIIDAASGKTLWSTYHKRAGVQYQKVMHFGLVTTISGLARRMSQEILNLWFKEGLHPCAE